MRPVEILYEDEHLLVADKPAGALVVPAPGRAGATVVDIVSRQLGSRVHAVHRLDEDTSGVLVLARTAEARAALETVFREHQAKRIYLALLSRMPSPAAGRIESRLREVRGVMRSVERGPGVRAVTRYRAVRRTGSWVLAECRPETGRRNQIRVHMAAVGAPLVCDRKYGYRGRSRFGRVMLHAWQIILIHPITGGSLRIEAVAREKELRA